MGAPMSYARKPGTGTIRRERDRWAAFTPRARPTREKRIGTFHTRTQAERALDEWLAGRRAP
jgi:hypothetical protein